MKRILLLIFLILIAPLPSAAAEIYFGYQSKEISATEKFEVGVFLNTKGDFVNAAAGDIIFPPDSVELIEVRNGSSILSLWVKQPYLDSAGRVVFSGVTPGGFMGDKGYLFSLIFKPKHSGRIAFSTANEKILLNDGTGAEASVTKAPLVLNAVQNIPAEAFVPPDDTNPPEAFQLYVTKDPDMFSGKWFLSFDTQDKESGVDHYEILEKPQPTSIFTLPFLKREPEWITGMSPHVLQDQTLQSIISVKVFDRAQNTTVAMLPAKHQLPWYENFVNWFIITVIGTVLLFLVYTAKFLRRNKIH